ncbi:MAG TPA: hypothetical protein VGS09_01875 [Actinomycetota bacterium]|jgi:hypothetical protein|nr:hypothetical protein [Actinomycetota bacterium]
MLIEIRSGIVLPDRRKELLEVLAGLGYEPHDVPQIERRTAEIAPIVVWVAQNIGAPAAMEIIKAVVRWARSKIGQRAEDGRIQVIWGPDGEVLAEVRVRDVRDSE